MGETAGWERPNWFADEGRKGSIAIAGNGRTGLRTQRAEHKAIRENVGLYDMSSFGKIRVEGPDAESFLNYVGGGDFSIPIGKIVYSQFLNEKGGIEADVTVTRLSETAYLVVTPQRHAPPISFGSKSIR